MCDNSPTRKRLWPKHLAAKVTAHAMQSLARFAAIPWVPSSFSQHRPLSYSGHNRASKMIVSQFWCSCTWFNLCPTIRGRCKKSKGRTTPPGPISKVTPPKHETQHPTLIEAKANSNVSLFLGLRVPKILKPPATRFPKYPARRMEAPLLGRQGSESGAGGDQNHCGAELQTCEGHVQADEPRALRVGRDTFFRKWKSRKPELNPPHMRGLETRIRQAFGTDV